MDANQIRPPKISKVYRIISDTDLKKFTAELNQAVMDGWEVDGQLCMAYAGTARMKYGQRMVKTVKTR